MNDCRLILGDCLDVLPTLEAGSVDAVVTDPPYGLAFMGKDWDSFKEGDIAMRRNPQMDAVNTGASRQGGRQRACTDYQKRQARDMIAFQEAMNAVFVEVLRVAKPGAHLLAFGGTRTYHRLACAIEDAGWEIRDCVMWVYGSGFPKSLDVSKAIDKAAGAVREVVGVHNRHGGGSAKSGSMAGPLGTLSELPLTAPATDAARQWSGWGTALKPAWEPVIVARKPLCGTVAENVLRHGTGAFNVDGCRVGDHKCVPWSLSKTENAVYGKGLGGHAQDGSESGHNPNIGRWPANLIHDGSDEVVDLFPCVNGVLGARREGGDKSIFNGGGHKQSEKQRIVGGMKDTGSAARFFYCAKASKADRDEGCDGLVECAAGIGDERPSGQSMQRLDGQEPRKVRNHHPTVKPTDLMRYLCRLVTPPGGLVLDPFAGSGSTGKAAALEGFRFLGIEKEAEYVEIARRRIAAVSSAMPLYQEVTA